MTKISLTINKICYSALFLALGWLLPFLTGQIPEIGSMLCPMHIPVMVAGFVLGPVYGLALGFLTPITRSLIFGMPVLFPVSIGMAFELATYGLICGLSFLLISKYFKKVRLTINVIISLIIAMILGRCVYGFVAYLLTFAGAYGGSYTFYAWISGVLFQAWPGLILQIVFIPLFVDVLYHYKVIQKFNPHLFTNNENRKITETN